MARHPKRKHEPATALGPDTDRLLDGDADLAARAAWMYFGANLTQAEVADRLNVPVTRAHRLIARASRDGVVRVFIDGPVAECVALEEAISAQFGLGVCHVAPDLQEGAMPMRALGLAGASFLRRALESGDHRIIGVGHGRTLASVVNHLPHTPASHVRFVSLIGGLTRRLSANPFEVIHRLADKTGAESYFLPVPVFANSIEDRAVLLAQRGISDVFALARQATLCLVGVSEIRPGNFNTSIGTLQVDEVEGLRRAGARGEILCHCFDAKGKPVESDLVDRAVSIPIESLTGRRIVAIAGGSAKVEALRAVLASGVLAGLITDEATAQALVRKRPAKAGASLADRRNGA